MVGGASKKMISDRLRHLEAHGLISRTVLATSPVAVEYFITARGRTALDFLGALKDWSEAEVVGPESSVVSSRARGS
jgi:DNA-binding HxlR family transcriptional regulator